MDEYLYIKPVRFNVLYTFQTQQQFPQGMQVTTGTYVNELLLDWKFISGIESFGEQHPNEFPNYPNNNKFRVLVPWGSYVCLGSYKEICNEFSEYKVWLHNNNKEGKEISFNLGAKQN